MKPPRAVAASAAFALCAGVAVWPPVDSLLYWQWLPGAAALGDLVVAPVSILALCLGIGFGAVTGVEPRYFFVGGLTAYLLGNAVLALAVAPDSPVHLLLYAYLLSVLTAGVTIGAVAWDPDLGRYRAMGR
ncbi:hypothetical protein [Halorientalis halophila]|uniref:hypothetical protein n=1 Tax=Halorientalis halophila TaxID=3108499 RepID=UPI00300B503C